MDTIELSLPIGMEVIDKRWNNENLLEKLGEGDPQAFESIVHIYSAELLQQAFKLVKDSHQAEDLVQDVFVEFWEQRHKLQINTSLSGYLYSMLKHRFLRLVSRINLHEAAMIHLLYRMDQMQDSILDVMAVADLQQTLADVIDHLPENMRKIFILRSEDYTLREIAQALGLAQQTVKSYHSELNRRLKKAIMTKHPDISHSLLAVIIIRLIES